MIREKRERFDPRLYELFEFFYNEMTRCAVAVQSRLRAKRAGWVFGP